MRRNDCELVESVRRTRDTLSPELQDHVEGCSACQDARTVDRGLRLLRQSSTTWKPLPDPGVVWLKARLVKLQQRTDTINRPFDLVQRVSWAVLSVAWVVLIAAQVPAVLSWISSFKLEEFVLEGFSSLPVSTRFIWLFVGLSAMTFTVLFHRVLEQD